MDRVRSKRTSVRIICALVTSLLLLTFLGCSSTRFYKPPELLPDDTRDIPEPGVQEINYGHDAYNKIFTRQMDQNLDFARQLRHIMGTPRQALNVNSFDEVPDSSWFTNRNGIKRLSLEEIARGPDTCNGPDTENTWTIIRAKVEGITPGFHIRDARGDRYLIKFDPKGYSELATGAEVVVTKILYAAGYNVPENYIAVFDPSILQPGEGVTVEEVKGEKRPLVQADIDKVVNKVHRLPDGRIRALASKYIDGKPLGGFYYEGTRDDDPNDIVPHEHRRELRGFYVLTAWLKHTDVKAGNNMDVYVTENGRGYIRHYLIDFGATLGSATRSPQARHKGFEHEIDTTALFRNILYLGLVVHDWERLEEVRYPSIGRFPSQGFLPGKSKPNIPNPAFENRTNRDGYWGAKLVMSFSDEHLSEVVKQGQYSDPQASVYLAAMLRERRDRTGRYWYSRICPLDGFAVTGDESGQPVLSFTDMGISGRLWTEDQTRYRYDLAVGGNQVARAVDLGNRNSIFLGELQQKIQSARTNTSRDAHDSQWEITLRLRRDSNSGWSKWVKVYLMRDISSGTYRILGLRREE